MVMLYQGHIDLGGGASSEAGGAAAGPECRGIKLTDESIQLHPFGFDTWIVNKILAMLKSLGPGVFFEQA
jgi:hypothetical protein